MRYMLSEDRYTTNFKIYSKSLKSMSYMNLLKIHKSLFGFNDDAYFVRSAKDLVDEILGYYESDRGVIL